MKLTKNNSEPRLRFMKISVKLKTVKNCKNITVNFFNFKHRASHSDAFENERMESIEIT